MKPIKLHFYIREEAILIFSLSAVSTAIRGLCRGSGMEALGGSAHSRDKLTECESLLHSRLNLLLARTFSLTYTHICWRVRTHKFTEIQPILHKHLHILPLLMQPHLWASRSETEDNESMLTFSMLLSIWFTQCLSNKPHCIFDIERYCHVCVRLFVVFFLWMNLALGKCGYDSFLSLLTGEVFMVPVRILGN